MDPQLELTELADRAGVSVRTIRYYIQQGLLPKPEARGPGAHYSEEHLERLLFVKRLQKEHLPLSEIRRAIEQGATAPARGASARDYINSVLKGPGYVAEFGAPATSIAPPDEASGARSQWERVALAPDIELHIRRPMSRAANRKVERLIDIALDLFQEDQ